MILDYKKDNSTSEVCTLSGNTNSIYSYAACYENYLFTKVDNENRITSMVSKALSLNESTNTDLRKLSIMTESKFSDSIKAKWNKLLEFIKQVVGKFMESLTSILVDQKGYLDKYKDIILKKKPKEIDFSYEGDYTTGIKRMIDTKLPLFDYGTYYNELKQEGYGPAVKKIMSGHNFEYDDGAELSDLFKNYFAATDAGTTKGTFDQLNMTDIYNFCYNVNKIEKIVKDDRNNLERSTDRIMNAIKTHVADNAANNTSEDNSSTEAPNESSFINDLSAVNAFLEDDANNAEAKPKQGSITINTDAVSQMSSYSKDNKQGVNDDTLKQNTSAIKGEVTEKEINDMISKWLTICRTFLTAKLTVCERISKSYMEIIRAHVRSYVGTKNPDDNKTADKGTNYANNKKETPKDNEGGGGEP